MQYLPGDNEILFHAYGPSLHASSMTKYDKQYNRSHIYKANRGATTLPEPMQMEINGAKYPMMDRSNILYFEGDHPRTGASFFRKQMQGINGQWVLPGEYAGLYSPIVSSNGEYIPFIYSLSGTYFMEHKRGIGILNTQTSQWETLSIPPLESSTPIVVKLAP